MLEIIKEKHVNTSGRETSKETIQAGYIFSAPTLSQTHILKLTYSLTNSHIEAYQRNDSHKYLILDFSSIPYQMVNKKPPVQTYVLLDQR